MKLRTGFVSNSSSGSFIMHWRVKTFGKQVSVVRAIANLFELPFKEETTGDIIDWEKSWNKEMMPKVNEMIRATAQNADGTFTTAFWTAMVNTSDDFGDSAKSLVMAILCSTDDSQLIDAKIEMDY